MKARNVKKNKTLSMKQKEKKNKGITQQNLYICILISILIVGILHVLVHDNEIHYIYDSYTLRGLAKSKVKKEADDAERSAEIEAYKKVWGVNYTIPSNIIYKKNSKTTRNRSDSKDKLDYSEPHKYEGGPVVLNKGDFTTMAKKTITPSLADPLKFKKCTERGYTIIVNHDIMKSDLAAMDGNSINDCCDRCAGMNSACRAVVFSGGDKCWMKSSALHIIDKPNNGNGVTYLAIPSSVHWDKRYVKETEILKFNTVEKPSSSTTKAAIARLKVTRSTLKITTPSSLKVTTASFKYPTETVTSASTSLISNTTRSVTANSSLPLLSSSSSSTVTTTTTTTIATADTTSTVIKSDQTTNIAQSEKVILTSQQKFQKCKELGFTIILRHDISQSDIGSKLGSSIEDCCNYCSESTLDCQAVVFTGNDRCWMKNSAQNLVDKPDNGNAAIAYLAIRSSISWDKAHVKENEIFKFEPNLIKKNFSSSNENNSTASVENIPTSIGNTTGAILATATTKPSKSKLVTTTITSVTLMTSTSAATGSSSGSTGSSAEN